MAENTVVKDQLTSAMVDAGAELASKLDEMGAAHDCGPSALRARTERVASRLRITEVATRGPREIYEKIRLARSANLKRRPRRYRCQR